MMRQRHIVHLLYRFAAGGLENVIVQLVDGLPHGEFRHTVIALTEADAAFAARIGRKDVDIISLHKSPGQPFRLYPAVYRLLRRLRPDVVHTCNLAALEFMPVAWLARIPVRIHAEHGWDIADPDGSNVLYRRLRRLYAFSVQHVVTVSPQIRDYWLHAVGRSEASVHLIPNGVDCERFRPRRQDDAPPRDWPFKFGEHHVVGSVGRFEPIKNPRLLVDAFIALAYQPGQEALRLAMVGDGPLRQPLLNALQLAGLADRAWLPGSRADIPEILRSLDCFILPSLAEGTSCTLQEAMASACAIIATDVGGNSDLLAGGLCGTLIPSGDVEAMCREIGIRDRRNPSQAADQARQRVVREYSLASTLSRYRSLFEG